MTLRDLAIPLILHRLAVPRQPRYLLIVKSQGRTVLFYLRLFDLAMCRLLKSYRLLEGDGKEACDGNQMRIAVRIVESVHPYVWLGCHITNSRRHLDCVLSIAPSVRLVQVGILPFKSNLRPEIVDI